MRILLIEPDRATAQSIELMMKAEGFNIYTTDLGEEGVDLGKLYDYDIVITELNLPDVSGYSVIRQLRMAEVPTPIMVLSGLGELDDKVRAFGYGVDDYLTKPFHKAELVARIHAIVRRSKGISQPLLVFGNLTIDLSQHTIRVGGVNVYFTAKEAALLEVLALRPNMCCPKELFLNHIYGGMDEPLAKIIDVFVCRVRRKLGNAGWVGAKIETIWGRGFLLATTEALNKRDAGESAQYIAEAVAA